MVLAVETKALTRRYGPSVAVEGLDLRVRSGEIYGLLGLNGAGKSTTVKMLTTLLVPTSGSARILGLDLREDALEVREAIGLVGDEAAGAYDGWTAREYVEHHAVLRGERASRARAREALGAAGLAADLHERTLHTFSTGMKRRCEIARALLGAPRVLFLDEPTRGLDLPAKMDLWAFLRGLSARGTTVFLSSHDVREIQALCGRIGVLAAGRLAYEGSLAELGGNTSDLEARLVDLLRGAHRTPLTSEGGSRG